MAEDASRSPASGRSSAPTAHEGGKPSPAVAGSAASADRPSLRPGGAASLVGRVLSGRYKIERLLGEGGMGAVYQAEHTHMRKRLAVKVLHPEMSRLAEVVARFEREAMAAAHIDHPNVATATDFGKLEDGSFFLVLEFVEGKSLRSSIAKGRLELGRALHIVRQVAAGLGRAHALGIVHRDLKPENVMLVEREGDPDFVKVLDFGIAKVPVGEIIANAVSRSPNDAAAPVLTQMGMVYGTPEYMAPEQALGQTVDPRADLYALGVMTFEMLTGKRPFDHESKVALLGMHVTAPVPSMNLRAPDADIPPEVVDLVFKLLAKEATDRHADAKELVEAVNAILAGLAAQGRIDTRFGGAAMTPPVSALNPSLPFGAPTPGPDKAPILTGSSVTGLSSGSFQAGGKRKLAIGAAVLGMVMLGGILVSVLAGGKRQSETIPTAGVGSGTVSASTHAGASPSASSGPPLATNDQDEIRQAIAMVEKGDFATGIARLTALEAQNTDRADIHHALENAYVATHQMKLAMTEASLWVKTDPTASKDLRLKVDVRDAAIGKDAADLAFTLLEQNMGPAGADVLYDIAYLASGAQYPAAAARAKRSLGRPDVRSHASPALDVTLDLRETPAPHCSARKLFERAAEDGDWRTVQVLKGYVPAVGCGFLNKRDCFPCLHTDSALTKTITAIEARAAKP